MVGIEARLVIGFCLGDMLLWRTNREFRPGGCGLKNDDDRRAENLSRLWREGLQMYLLRVGQVLII